MWVALVFILVLLKVAKLLRIHKGPLLNLFRAYGEISNALTEGLKVAGHRQHPRQMRPGQLRFALIRIRSGQISLQFS